MSIKFINRKTNTVIMEIDDDGNIRKINEPNPQKTTPPSEEKVGESNDKGDGE